MGLRQAHGSFGAVAMLGLDDLKAVNHAHGHASGDELLRRLSDVLRRGLRPSEKLYRWGGDEFLLMMPGANRADLVHRLEVLLATAFNFGACEYEGAESLAGAIPAADGAMYEEKKRRKLPSVEGEAKVG